MRFIVKVCLFLSAYIFLFLILAIKNLPNTLPVIIFLFILGICMVVWALVLLDVKTSTGEYFLVLSSENKTQESLNYLAPYLVAFLNFNLFSILDLTVLIIFLVLIFFIYLNTDLIYTNPSFALFQIKIFRIEVCTNTEDCDNTKKRILYLSRNEKIKLGEKKAFKKIDKGVYI